MAAASWTPVLYNTPHVHTDTVRLLISCMLVVLNTTCRASTSPTRERGTRASENIPCSHGGITHARSTSATSCRAVVCEWEVSGSHTPRYSVAKPPVVGVHDSRRRARHQAGQVAGTCVSPA
jgi:hypothetical protein